MTLDMMSFFMEQQVEVVFNGMNQWMTSSFMGQQFSDLMTQQQVQETSKYNSKRDTTFLLTILEQDQTALDSGLVDQMRVTFMLDQEAVLTDLT